MWSLLMVTAFGLLSVDTVLCVVQLPNHLRDIHIPETLFGWTYFDLFLYQLHLRVSMDLWFWSRVLPHIGRCFSRDLVRCHRIEVAENSSEVYADFWVTIFVLILVLSAVCEGILAWSEHFFFFFFNTFDGSDCAMFFKGTRLSSRFTKAIFLSEKSSHLEDGGQFSLFSKVSTVFGVCQSHDESTNISKLWRQKQYYHFNNGWCLSSVMKILLQHCWHRHPPNGPFFVCVLKNTRPEMDALWKLAGSMAGAARAALLVLREKTPMKPSSCPLSK
jgi:hypothetical protein